MKKRFLNLDKNNLCKSISTLIVSALLLFAATHLAADNLDPKWIAAQEKWHPIAEKAMNGDEEATKKLNAIYKMAEAGEITAYEYAVVLTLHAYWISQGTPEHPQVQQLYQTAAQNYRYPVAQYYVGDYENSAKGGVTGAAIQLGNQALDALEKAESTEAKVWLLEKIVLHFKRALETRPDDRIREYANKQLAEAVDARKKYPLIVFPENSWESSQIEIAIYAELDAMHARMPRKVPVNHYAMCGNEPELYPANPADIHHFNINQFNQAVNAYNAHFDWSKCHKNNIHQVLATIKAIPGTDYSDIKYRSRKNLIEFLTNEKSEVEAEMLRSAAKLQAKKDSATQYNIAVLPGPKKRAPYGSAIDSRRPAINQMATAKKSNPKNSRTRYKEQYNESTSGESKGDRYQRQLAEYDNCMSYAQAYRAASEQAYIQAANRCRSLYPDGM